MNNTSPAPGEPNDLVASARPGRPAPVRRGPREIFAVLLLLTGIPLFLGWIVGLGLLVWSPLWTARQKLLGALVWPGGFMVTLGGAFLVEGPVSRVCTSATAVPLHGAAGTTLTTLRSVAESCTTTGGRSSWAVLALALAFVAPVLVAVYLYVAAGRRTVDV